MDNFVKASLDWLNSIAYPNSGFDHPNDENKVKCASRALNKLGIPVNLDEVRDYCQSLNWPSDSIARVVDWYSRPTRLRLTCGLKWETEDLKEIWERKC